MSSPNVPAILSCFVFILCFIYQLWNQVQQLRWMDVLQMMSTVFSSATSSFIWIRPLCFCLLDGETGGILTWTLVDPPTSAEVIRNLNPFFYFWNVLIIAHFPDCFYIFAASHNTTGYPWAKGNEIEFHNGPLFYLKILTLPPFLFVSLCGDLVIYLEK